MSAEAAAAAAQATRMKPAAVATSVDSRHPRLVRVRAEGMGSMGKGTPQAATARATGLPASGAAGVQAQEAKVNPQGGGGAQAG